MRLYYLFLLLGCFGFVQTVQAQTDPQFYDYPQNHLKWFTIETTHFLIHFQEGNSRSAQVTSRVAEEIYTPITDLYQYEPDGKVSIVLKDREDYSNGAAYFFDNKIDIWLPALDSPLRGTHNWLRNVITHEFTHIVQIQTAMKRDRSFPVTYFQWLSYEDVRRPDVLYGFPNGIITHPFVSINVPAWLAEGTAQYQRTGLYYETWDAHRDMILRTRILSDSYFSLTEMGTFSSKNSLERETVYNQGYAFVIYLVNRFGEDVLRSISEALANKGTYDVATAIESATGIDGHVVFEDWIRDRTAFYTEATSKLSPSPSSYIESEGIFNFYPKSTADGNTIAYLSNKGRDHSLVSLYVKHRDELKELGMVARIPDIPAWDHTALFENPVIAYLGTSFSFSPDGSQIVYSVNKATKYGESYRDLFTYNLNTDETKRLTKGARIESPAWSPNGKLIAAVQYHKGTQNLVFINPDNSEITPLTDFQNGETIYTPSWHPDGEQIYFAKADLGNRSIYVLDVTTGDIQPVLKQVDIDFRDPQTSPDGQYLYYAADEDGIFNIYRYHLEKGSSEQITNVLGGAFMPNILGGDHLLYAEYEADGYKIKRTDLTPTQSPGYQPQFTSTALAYAPPAEDIQHLNEFDDRDLSPISDSTLSQLKREPMELTFNSAKASNESATIRKYEDTFTDFSFFPVIRFDNYTKKNGNNGTLLKEGRVGDLGENLLRDFKPGFYFSTRDVLDKLTIFGGAMLGVASRPAESIGGFFKPDRILELDRDLFLIAEHRGLPFIEASWSPTVSIELYNLRRNVSNGLQIEEFKCTSCVQKDTSNVDIAYQIWEANLFLRSKLSRRSLLEFGIGYSPYTVETDNFFSKELNALVSGSSSQYFKGTTLSAAYTFNYYEFTTDADIAPVGLKGYLRYQYQPSKLLDEYEIKDGALLPIYSTTKNHSAELHLRYGFKLASGQAFQARTRGFAYFNTPEDSFYTDYIGGFMGMRSYPYFALGGDRTVLTSLSYFAPLIKNITKQAGPYTIDKLYARLFFETGNVWNSPFSDNSSLKSGVGAELRLAMNGYYLFPLKFFISTSYGLNEFDITLPPEFVTGSQSNRVTYGREFIFHFGLTFDFELL